MVCDRLTCNFAIARARMNARMTNLVQGGVPFCVTLVFSVIECEKVLQMC